MPIIEPAPTEAPLSQGDILALPNGGCALNLASGNVEFTNARFGLVISRDCAGTGAGAKVLIAEIFPTKPNFPNNKTFSEIAHLLAVLRDGGTSPDTFYLGTIPGVQGRVAAKLDSVSTVKLPDGTSRAVWLKAHRTHRLVDDFRRALTTRLYWALCRQGFDDHNWFATHDLEHIRNVGLAEKSRLSTAVHDAQAERSRWSAEGDSNPKAVETVSKKLSDAQAALESFEAELAPYLTALEARESRPEESG